VFYKAVIGSIAVAVLYLGQDLFVPLGISVLLAFSLSPVVRFVRRSGLSKGLAVAVTVAIAFLAIFAIGAVITSQVTQLGGELPRLQTSLKAKVRAFNDYAGSEGGTIDQASNTLRDLEKELNKGGSTAPTAARPGRPSLTKSGAAIERVPVEVYPPPPTALEQIESIISVALSPLTTAGIIVVFVVFLLLKQSDVRDRAIRLIGSHDLERTTVALEDAGTRLSSYFLTLVVMNAGFGAAIGAGLWVIGIPNAILWGIVAMLLRFMPVIGVFIAAAIPVLLAAAVDPGWVMLGTVVALYLAAEGVMNLVVEPLAQSSSTGLSALAIMLAAAFWTLLWGPIGLLLAVPLTAVLVVLGRHVEGLSFLHVLLGDSPPLTPAESFYQRMLAGDPLEAAEQAEVILKDKTLTAYFDDVVMEGLRHAQVDADHQKLEQSRLADIRDTATAMIELLTEPAAPKDGTADTAPLPESWSQEGAIVCVAGQSALDELGAMILAHLLTQQGFRPRLMRMPDVSSAQMQGDAVAGVKMVCISLFDIEHRSAYLKFLMRRLGRIFPAVALLGGFWKFDASDTRQADMITKAGVITRVDTLGDAVAACLAMAAKDQPPAEVVSTTPAQ
jgi:predicted PurR-regulated permease PerM